MAEKLIEHKALGKHFLTLDEMASFVDIARNEGARGDEVVEGSVSFGGKLQKLRVRVGPLNDPKAPADPQ